MKKNLIKFIVMFIFFIITIYFLQIKSNAGSFSISSSPSNTAEPGSTISISITGKNATGKVNLSGTNITLNQSTVWIEDNTVSVTGTVGTEGTAKVSVTAVDVVDSINAEEVTGTKTLSLTIKKKEEVKPTTQTKENQTTNKKEKTKTQSTNNKKTTTTTTTTKETIQKEETNRELGIYTLNIKGITHTEEKQEIKLDQEFKYNKFEYSCTVSENINKLEIQTEAYEYNDLVKIEGIEELKYGENIITIKLNKDNNEIKYIIKVFKQGNEIVEEVKQEEIVSDMSVEETKDENIIKMPLINFILVQISIILIEIIVCSIIIKRKRYNK